MHQHCAGGRETTIPAIATDNGHSNERDGPAARGGGSHDFGELVQP